jgi:hypothetical protein
VLPCWLAVVTVSVAKAEPAKASNALSIKTTREIFIRLGGLWMS